MSSPSSMSYSSAAALRRARQPQVRDVLPVRRRLPHRDHRHGRRGHQEPLPRPLGPARAVRRAARGVGAAALGPARAGRGFTALGADRSWRRSRRYLIEEDYDPHRCCASWSGRRSRTDTCRSPRSSTSATPTGAWYSEIYGIATSYPHLSLRAGPTGRDRPLPVSDLPVLGGGRIREALEEALATEVGGVSPEARSGSWRRLRRRQSATSRWSRSTAIRSRGVTPAAAADLATRLRAKTRARNGVSLERGDPARPERT